MKKLLMMMMAAAVGISGLSLSGCDVWVHGHDRDHVDHHDIVVHPEVGHDDHHDDHHDDPHWNDNHHDDPHWNGDHP